MKVNPRHIKLNWLRVTDYTSSPPVFLDSLRLTELREKEFNKYLHCTFGKYDAMRFKKSNFALNRNTLISKLNSAKWTVSQSSSLQQDASVKAVEGHRPPLPQGQGWEVCEQRKEGDAGMKQIELKTSLKLLPNLFGE